MKEYDCEDYYELGERLTVKGAIVEVVKDVCACNDCYLRDLMGVFCSSHCSVGERIDSESVCFRLVDMAKKNTPEYEPFNPDKEYQLYERFQHNGVVAECRKCSSPLLCRDCVLYPCNGASIKACKCMASSREDKTSVYYKVLTDVRP